MTTDIDINTKEPPTFVGDEICKEIEEHFKSVSAECKRIVEESEANNGKGTQGA